MDIKMKATNRKAQLQSLNFEIKLKSGKTQTYNLHIALDIQENATREGESKSQGGKFRCKVRESKI